MAKALRRLKARDYPPVLVEWLDAHEDTGDCTPSTIKHEPSHCRTVGFLIRRDNAGVTLASECNDTDEGVELRTTNFIPRGMVRRVVRLKG